ncbi:MAG TPA: tetratricopeptide repeat protein [Myxococcaceae bacterium]|nr:tetratricopeptide repeat protein [Myxococcaceae bacterium]
MLAVVLSVAWLGGALPGAWVAAATLGALALLLVAGERGGTLSLPPLALVPFALGLLCLVQLVPLPGGLLGAVGPASAELRDFALVPLGLTRARPVSVDAPATWMSLALAAGVGAALAAAAELARSRRSRRRLAAAIGLTGLGVAVIGYGHALAGAQMLFGVHQFQNAQLALLTPFGNPNHLAGFLTLSTVLLLGLSAEAQDRQQVALWVGLAVLGGAAAFLSLSRGGIFFFVLGQLAFLGTLLAGGVPFGSREDYRPVPRMNGRARLFAVGGGVAGVLAVASYLALDRITARLSTLDSMEKIGQSKVELWPMFARAVAHVWPLGLGRGAFGVGFPRWQTEGAFYTFTHPESWPLQWAAEVGIPAAVFLVALAGWAAFRTLRRDASALERAAACGLVALVLHDLFDFALELPACAMAAAVAAGIVSGRVLAEGRGLRVGPRGGWALAAGVAVLVALGLWRGRDRADEASLGLARAAAAGVELDALRASAVAAIDVHPAEASLYRTVGWTEAQRRPRDALAFLERALWLRPLDSETHRVAARVLLRLGAPEQAMGEWRLARETGVEAGTVLGEALPYARTPELLARLVGPDLSDVPLVVTLLWGAGRHADAEGVLAWAREQAEGRPGLGGLWASAASLRLGAGHPSEALPLLDEAERRGEDVALLRAQALTVLGRPREAIQVLEAEVARRPQDAEVGFALAAQWQAAGKPALARQALERLQPFLAGGAARVRLLAAEAETFRAEGRLGRALEALDTARRLQPENAGLHYQAAQLYEQMGRLDAAAEAVRAGARAEGPAGAERARAWLERLEREGETQRIKALEGPTPLEKMLGEEESAGADGGARSAARRR